MYAEALRVAVQAARTAGGLLRAEFHRPGGARAAADREAELAVRELLTAACPTWGYLGEETGAAPGSDAAGHLWLVDPNDGTSAFVAGHRGSAVAIALLRDGRPVLGVVYAFAAPDDDGDLFAWAAGCGPLTRNGEPVQRGEWPAALGPESVVAVSPAADEKPAANQRCVAPGRFLKAPGIAYRLALVAAGEADACLSLNHPVGWDYAAGHALLQAAGGALVDEAGRPVTYSRAGDSHVHFCFGGAPALVAELRRRPWADLLAGPRELGAAAGLVGLEPGRAVADAGLLRRAQGALLGQLAGDALGSLVEFRPPAEIARLYPGGPRALADGGTWDTLAGQPTDDSELALELARAIVARGGYEPEAAARAYVRWHHSDPFDEGGTTAQALGAVEPADVSAGRAAPVLARSASRSSQANGSLMRLSPLGVWGHALPAPELAALAQADSSLTHAHPVCREAGAVFAVALADAVATGAGPAEIGDRALAWAERHAAERSVVEALRAARAAPPADYLTHQGWVRIALQNAFYQLRHAASLEEGVVATVAAGGDTDTNAAIAGALLGAVHGRDAVPQPWRRMLLSCRPVAGLPAVRRPRPPRYWPTDALALAERLLLAGR